MFIGATIGGAYGRTAACYRMFRRGYNPERGLAGGTVWGGAVGAIVLLAVTLLGVRDVPRWCYVPETFVLVQVGFSNLFGYLADKFEPDAVGFMGEDCVHLAYYIFGLMTLPSVAVFIIVMTLANVL